MISRRQDWQESINNRMNPKGGLPEVVSDINKQGIFNNWELLAAPGGSKMYFGYAVDIACGDFHHPYVKQFLDWAIAHCERSLVDPRFEIESDIQKIGWRNSLYFRRHGETLELLALASAFRNNQAIESPVLIQAAKELAEYYLNCGHWDYVEQFPFLVCVHYLLIAEGKSSAMELLKSTRKKFKQVQRHYNWLISFIEAINEDGVITDSSKIEAFQEYFDEIRSPKFISSKDYENGMAVFYPLPILRLQFALLKQRYIVSKDLANQWQDVVGYISQ